MFLTESQRVPHANNTLYCNLGHAHKDGEHTDKQNMTLLKLDSRSETDVALRHEMRACYMHNKKRQL